MNTQTQTNPQIKPNATALWTTALATLLTLLLVSTQPVFANGKKEYHLLGEPKTGTRIPTKLVTSPTPLDATYAELDDASKANIKANYENMPVSDEPPFPTEGLEPLWKEITKVSYGRNQIGGIVAIASVSPEGKVEKVAMYDTTSSYMTRVVSAALFATPFKPGVCDGKACAMDFILEGEINIDLMQN